MVEPGDKITANAIGDAGESVYNAQWWLLFAIMVANKPAEITARKLNEFLSKYHWSVNSLPFDVVKDFRCRAVMGVCLREARTGQYTRIQRAFEYIAGWRTGGDDPRPWSLEFLEGIPGVGPKTARWFYMLVNPEAKVAALDTHVLKFLKDQGFRTIPKTTPPAGENYVRLEEIFVNIADTMGMTPAQLDFAVWAAYRNGWRIVPNKAHRAGPRPR